MPEKEISFSEEGNCPHCGAPKFAGHTPECPMNPKSAEKEFSQPKKEEGLTPKEKQEIEARYRLAVRNLSEKKKQKISWDDEMYKAAKAIDEGPGNPLVKASLVEARLGGILRDREKRSREEEGFKAIPGEAADIRKFERKQEKRAA